MAKYNHSRTSVVSVVGFALPELHTGRKAWYIDYYVRHPSSGKAVRKRIKLNRYRDLARRKQWARLVVDRLTRKLLAGWTPWDRGTGEGGHTIGRVLDQWDEAKARQLRHSSPYSYSSMTQMIRAWLIKNDMLDLSITAFDRPQVAGFLRYISEERQVSNRTYNNYIVFLTMLFNWMIENDITESNPAKIFRKRKTTPKSRTYLSDQERSDMVNWIQRNDPALMLPCLFIFGTLIRPAELRRLKVHHVDLDRQVVQLPAEETKSGIERTPAIPDWLLQILLEHGLDKHPGKAWLLGSRLVPSERPIARNTLNRRWVKMRKQLGWDDRRQLYSLRDTGIIQLIRDGVDLLHVMQQAGHTEIGTTNKYLKHAFPKGPAEVREKSTPLKAASPIITA